METQQSRSAEGTDYLSLAAQAMAFAQKQANDRPTREHIARAFIKRRCTTLDDQFVANLIRSASANQRNHNLGLQRTRGAQRYLAVIYLLMMIPCLLVAFYSALIFVDPDAVQTRSAMLAWLGLTLPGTLLFSPLAAWILRRFNRAGAACAVSGVPVVQMGVLAIAYGVLALK